ncbi:hypothetical protein RRG08_050708 [Elysia crispata]|uniref:Uncharacterized protein n=1 Tax=Elysia crispata TaxID=231223 RepID=A0AAE1B5U8_9GAST|nr:hypothetical protein RRG08_050708 [Elysia crispata]
MENQASNTELDYESDFDLNISNNEEEGDGDGANEPVDNMPVAAQPTQGAAEPGSWVDQPSAISLQDEAMNKIKKAAQQNRHPPGFKSDCTELVEQNDELGRCAGAVVLQLSPRDHHFPAKLSWGVTSQMNSARVSRRDEIILRVS